MAARREVDVNRPEHSWIPFYRELAEKLADPEENWRGRQAELVRVLKEILNELESEGVPVPSVGNDLDQHVDPFTVLAVIARELDDENYRKTLQAFKGHFELTKPLPERPEIPYVFNLSVGFFGTDSDIEAEGAMLWDVFKLVLKMDHFEETDKINKLIELIDASLDIDQVGMAKLTGGFYWINPTNFLKTDTLSVLLGEVSKDELENGDGKFYVECLIRARESTDRPFPEINIDEYETRDFLKNDRIWLVRAQSGEWTNDFVQNGYIGIGYNMNEIDLTRVSSSDVITQLYKETHPNETNPHTIGQEAGNIARFHLDIQNGDYVVTPERDRNILHYGIVTDDATYYVKNDDGKPCRNRRGVMWAPNVLDKKRIGVSDWQQGTITRIRKWKRGVFAEMMRKGLPMSSTNGYTIDNMYAEGLFFERDKLQEILDRFNDKKNLILQGPPGVGKTFIAETLPFALMGEKDRERVRYVQFHQSYSYEDFVRGYRPVTNRREELIFKMQSGTFLRLCEEARAAPPEDKYVMIIDEINRGNLSRVFGELLSLVEKNKRGGKFSVELLGDQESSDVRKFSVPENVYILGMMNLADRSLAGMDYAMRRRFAFWTLKPLYSEEVFEDWLRKKRVPPEMITRINDRMSALNDEIADPKGSLGRNFAVGHSYFCDIAEGGEEDWDGWYREIVETEIKPLLEEYWFDDLAKADEEVEKLLNGVG